MDGIINLLKPPGMTSSDAVSFMRRILRIKKVGHTGTLDPGVVGVLPLCVGKATRVAEYLTAQGKGYLAEITFGLVTDTQDSYGEVVAQTRPKVNKQDFQEALSQFEGEIEQIPPMFSAVRRNGKHLYEYARKGISMDREPRKVTITSTRLIRWEDGVYPKAIFEVSCSKGTYIRTLCHDIGEKLGCGAHMSFLVRTFSGPFTIEKSWTLEEIEEGIQAGETNFMLPLNGALSLPKVYLPLSRVKPFQSGLSTRWVDIEGTVDENIIEGREVQVLFNQELIGIGIVRNDILYPHKVLK